MVVVATARLMALESTADPSRGYDWIVKLHSSTVAQNLSRTSVGPSALITTYYQFEGMWIFRRWLGVQTEIEGGQVIGENQDTQLGVNLGSQWKTNEMQEASRHYVPVLALIGSTPAKLLSWKIGKISSESFFDDNRGARAKRTKFLSTPLSKTAAVSFGPKGLGGSLTWSPNQHTSVTVLGSDANARETLTGFATWRGEWFTAAEVTLRPSSNPEHAAVRILGWSTTRHGVHDGGCSISADYEMAPKLVGFARLGTGSSAFARTSNLLSGGIGWEAPFGRKADFFGAGVTWGEPVKHNARIEVLSEIVYRWQLTQHLALSPDLQLVHHPANSNVSSAVVTGLRCAIAY